VDGNDARYALAVLDNSIIDLAVEAKAARDMAQEAATRAERLGTVRTRLMEVRDKIRHVQGGEHGRV
jgi:hypothetical protein